MLCASLCCAVAQPGAKLLVTLAEPVRRMHSDYYFLTANGVARTTNGKGPTEFHALATEQVGALLHARSA